MQTRLPAVSVIIPTYNRLPTLSLVLGSYLSQPETLEVIVVNDASSDTTASYLERLSRRQPKLRILSNVSNQGGPASKNRGIKSARGKYVFIGEDDLKLPPHFLQTLLSHLRSHKADIISGRRIWMKRGESESEALQRANSLVGNLVNTQLLTTNCELKLPDDVESPLLDASMLIERSAATRILYDEKYRRTAWREETDYQLSAISLHYKLVFCPHAHAFHLFKDRNTGGNHSHSNISYELQIFRNNLYMYQKHLQLLQANFQLNIFFFPRFIYYRLRKLISQGL